MHFGFCSFGLDLGVLFQMFQCFISIQNSGAPKQRWPFVVTIMVGVELSITEHVDQTFSNIFLIPEQNSAIFVSLYAQTGGLQIFFELQK